MTTDVNGTATREFRSRLAYFLFYSAIAAILPVATLYYESVGVSGVRLGFLAALWPAGGMLGASLFGAVADGTARHRLVLSITIVTAAVAAQLFLVGKSFVTLVPIVLLFALASGPIAPMLDHGVLTALADRHGRFGRVRIWGAFGWGISAPLVGMAVDRASLTIVFPIYGILMMGLLATSFALPLSSGVKRVDVRAGLREIIRSGAWRRFLLLVLLTSSGGAVLNSYLFVYLNEIGATATLRGVALAVATVSELSILGLSSMILRRFRPQTLLLVSIGAIGLRLLLYGLIDNPILALLPQLLHGLTFGLRLVAGVAIAREIAPQGMGGTAHALFSGTSQGAAGIIGALLGGVLYRRMPVSQVMLIVGVAELTLLAGILLFRAVRRKA